MRLPRYNRGTWLAAVGLVLVAIVVAGVAVRDLGKPKNTYNPKVAFQSTDTTSTTAAKGPFLWPIYGFNDARTRVFNGPASFDDPADWQVEWKLPGNAPIEFPPDIDGNSLFFMDDHASVNKVDATTGKRWWRKQIGQLSAASPALDPKLGLLYVPVLSTTSDAVGATNGGFFAMSMKNGAIKWHVSVPSGTESSPLVWGNNVYFGDQAGTVYDLNPKTGHVNWSFPTSDSVKGGPTLAKEPIDGHDVTVLYFGNYAGDVYAVNASTGKQIWEQSIGPNIYASPTVAYGRIYVGNTSGGFYSLSATNGTVAWSRDVGHYVYSSAAVDDAPKLGPTVYFGTYDAKGVGTAYALNARTGDTEWAKSFGNSISGAASIVNDTVFFSGVYPPTQTKGYNITTGVQDFTFPDGAYTATVASPERIYLSGHYVLYGLAPKS